MGRGLCCGNLQPLDHLLKKKSKGRHFCAEPKRILRKPATSKEKRTGRVHARFRGVENFPEKRATLTSKLKKKKEGRPIRRLASRRKGKRSFFTKKKKGRG